MVYPENIKPSIARLSPNVVTLSCPLAMLGKFDVGNRMSIINCNGKVVAFSPIPYGSYVLEALDLLAQPP